MRSSISRNRILLYAIFLQSVIKTKQTWKLGMFTEALPNAPFLCQGAALCPWFRCEAKFACFSDVNTNEGQSPTLVYKPAAIKVCCYDKLPQSRSFHFNYAARSMPVVLKLRSVIGLCWPIVHGSCSKVNLARLLSDIIELTVFVSTFHRMTVWIAEHYQLIDININTVLVFGCIAEVLVLSAYQLCCDVWP
jgi:hypothetical protein